MNALEHDGPGDEDETVVLTLVLDPVEFLLEFVQLRIDLPEGRSARAVLAENCLNSAELEAKILQAPSELLLNLLGGEQPAAAQARCQSVLQL